MLLLDYSSIIVGPHIIVLDEPKFLYMALSLKENK